MNSDSQTLKGSPEDNLSFIKQVEMDLSIESVEDRRNGNRTKHRISWMATLSKFTWIQDQGSCQSLHGVYRYDTWQIDELLHNADSLVSTFQYETRDLRDDMVPILPFLDGL